MVGAPIPAAQGGPLKGDYKYTLETWRHEGNWRVSLQWIEARGSELVPMVVELPHEVCEAIASHREAILKQSRKYGY